MLLAAKLLLVVASSFSFKSILSVFRVKPMSSPATVEVKVSELETMVKALVMNSFGYPEKHAQVMTDVLMYAQLRHNSQGAIKLITAGIPQCPSNEPLEVEYETKLSARINGNQLSGMVVMNQAVEMAIAKAQEHGFGIVATKNTSSGTGAIGYFGHLIASRGLIGFVFSQSPELVAPYGSYEPIFGTNPFSIGIPTKEGAPPIVLDMATSAYAWFAVKEAKLAGRPIPDDVAYDPEGHPTTDPAAALAGALRVFDRSYKGSHLALMVEILGGALAGGEIEEKSKRNNSGNLVFVIDPSLLGPTEEFHEKTQVLIERIKNAKKLPGVEEIILPGERGDKRYAKAIETGKVTVEANLYNSLREAFQAIQ